MAAGLGLVGDGGWTDAEPCAPVLQAGEVCLALGSGEAVAADLLGRALEEGVVAVPVVDNRGAGSMVRAANDVLLFPLADLGLLFQDLCDLCARLCAQVLLDDCPLLDGPLEELLACDGAGCATHSAWGGRIC